jgi:hypothetical protein
MFTAENLTSSSMSVAWRYKYPGQDLVDSLSDRRMTGFRINWSSMEGGREKSLNEEWKQVSKLFPMFGSDNNGLVMMVNAVQEGRNTGMKNTTWWMQLVMYKLRPTTMYQSSCRNGKIEKNQLLYEVNKFVQILGYSSNSLSDRKTNVSDENIREGIKMYNFLAFCPEGLLEAVKLVKFHDELLTNHSARSIIQATMNNLMPDTITSVENSRHMEQFYEKLDSHFGFTHGISLLASATMTDMEEILETDLVYARKYFNKMQSCSNKSCNLFTSFGKLFIS